MGVRGRIKQEMRGRGREWREEGGERGMGRESGDSYGLGTFHLLATHLCLENEV